MQKFRAAQPVSALAAQLLLVLISLPVFFDTYREMIFNTVPHDDYAPYLLHIIGQPGGTVPPSPFAERYLSVLAAVPFFHLPQIRFTLAPNLSDATLHAYEAQAFTSWLSIVLTALLFFHWARSRGNSLWGGLLAGAGSLLLCHFVGLTGIDGIAILCIATLVYAHARGWTWAVCALLLLAIGINEKILIVAFLYFALLMLEKKASVIYAIASAAGFAGYLCWRMLGPFHGYENQVRPASMLQALLGAAPYWFSSKGVALNLVPSGILLLLVVLLARTGGGLRAARTPALVTLGMIGIALVSRLEFTAGRVVMFTYPVVLAGLLTASASTGARTEN